ncbi:MAG: Gfo/Idh/MocA family protein [Promethearchaeota archaeon]
MEKIQFGIMGFGAFAGRRLVPGFNRSSLAEIIALTKRDAVAAAETAKEYGIPHYHTYSDLNKFFEIPGMEAVYVASSNNVHLRDAVACLEAGKHVLLEKPMAMNASECKEINEAAEESGKVLMIAHCLRFNKTVEHFRDIVKDHKLGKLVSGKCDFFSNGKASSRSWKYDKSVAGGGAAFDLGVHVIDTMRYITQFSILNACCSHVPRNRGPNEVDEVATFLLEFNEEFTASCTSSFRGTRNLLLELFGERGYIRAYDWNQNLKNIRVESEIDGERKEYVVVNEDMYAAEIDAFCRCIRGDIENPVPGSEGLINQQLIDMVNR